MKPRGVRLVTNCSRCGEAVELELTKKQVKALLKGFKAGSPGEADLIAEKEGALE